MAVDSLGFFAAVSGPEGPLRQVGMVCRREQRKPIDASVLTKPVASMDVIRVSVFGKTRSLSLLCREESLLAFGNLIEPPVRLYAGPGHCTIRQFI